MSSRSEVKSERLYSKRMLVTLITVLAFMTTSCGKGKSSVPGLEKFHAGVLKQNLYVSLVATALHWDAGLTVPVPGLEGAEVSVSPDLSSDGTVIQFSVGLDALLKDTGLTEKTLPDGRAIPDIDGGKLPRWDVQIGKLPITFYLSEETFGLFIPMVFQVKNQKLLWQVSVRVEDERGNLMGKAYAIPQKGKNTQSGLLVLLPYFGGKK